MQYKNVGRSLILSNSLMKNSLDNFNFKLEIWFEEDFSSSRILIEQTASLW